MGGANEISLLRVHRGNTFPDAVKSLPRAGGRFLLASCEWTRRTLGLSTDQAPMTKKEEQAIPMIFEPLNNTV
jgi:hypothetical protein